MNKSLKIILLGVVISSLPFAGYAQDKPSVPAPADAAKTYNQVFRFHAPVAETVALAGEFNNWKPQSMSQEIDGSWSTTVALPAGTYGYKFLVNGKESHSDPDNPLQKTVGNVGRSAIAVTEEQVAESPSNSAPPSPHIFYLTQRLSLTTSTGIIGFNPGTGVQVLKDNGQTLHVLAEGTEMDIPKNVLTDDVGYAQTVATSDYNARLQTAQEVSHQQEVAQQMKAQEDKQINLQPQKQSQAAVGSWSSSSANPLNQRPVRNHPPMHHLRSLHPESAGKTESAPVRDFNKENEFKALKSAQLHSIERSIKAIESQPIEKRNYQKLQQLESDRYNLESPH